MSCCVKLCCFFILLWTNTGFSKPNIEWSLVSESALIERANRFLASSTLPKESTIITYHVKLDVSQDEVIRTVQQIWYYPTHNATQDMGTETIYLDHEVESLKVKTAGSLAFNGKFNSFDPSTVRIVESDSYNTFTDTKDVMLVIPGLVDQSVSILEYSVITNRDKLEADWFESYYPQLSNPVNDFSLIVDWEKSAPVYWYSSSDLVHCTETMQQVKCEGKNIPAIKSDKSVVWRDILGQISVGELNSWQQVINLSYDAFNKARKSESKIAELFNQLTEGHSSIRDKIMAIHSFVARDIRYVSMSELGHRITPHSLDSIIKNRYGDCKDKSALLFSLLRRLNVDAFPVLVATKRKKYTDLKLPSMGYFDHMVVCYNLDGKSSCIDATDQETDWRTVSSWIQGKVALPLRINESIQTIPSSRFRWNMDVLTNIKFSVDGSQTENQTRIYSNEYAGTMRALLAPKKTNERLKWAIDQYQQSVSDGAKPKFTFSGLNELSHELTVKSDHKFAPFLDTEKDLSYYEKDAWVTNELESVMLSNEHYDDEFPGLEISSQYNIDFNDIWRINRLPPKLYLKHEYGSLKRNITKVTKEGYVTVETYLAIPNRRVEKNDIDKFNRFLKKLVRESNMKLGGVHK